MSDLPGVFSRQKVSLVIPVGFTGELMSKTQVLQDLILFFA